MLKTFTVQKLAVHLSQQKQRDMRPMKKKQKGGAKPSETRKCRKCGKQVKKTNFEVKESGRLSYACNRCRVIGIPKITSKKAPEVEKFRINSMEEKHEQRLTAIEALERAKKREAEILKSGARYVKGELRSYILRG